MRVCVCVSVLDYVYMNCDIVIYVDFMSRTGPKREFHGINRLISFNFRGPKERNHGFRWVTSVLRCSIHWFRVLPDMLVALPSGKLTVCF